MNNLNKIITIDPYQHKNYVFKDGNINRIGKLSYNTSNFITSFISSKKVIIEVLEISANILEEDIANVLELKAYEELGLDQVKEYRIEYFAQGRHNEFERYIVCVIDPEEMDEDFGEILQQTKYLDLLMPAPLLYGALYKKRIITSSSSVHAYINIGLDDLFITFYRDGEYFYSKSIDGSLKEFHIKYMEITGEEISDTEFYEILHTTGLKSSDGNIRQAVSRILSDMFSEISAVLIYAKRSFDFDFIEDLFYSTSFGEIPGFSEQSYSSTGTSSIYIPFDFGIVSSEPVDLLQILMATYSELYINGTYPDINFLLYDRPPPFHKRASGQFLISLSLATLIGLSVPGFFLAKSYINKGSIYLLEKENLELSAQSSKYQDILSKQRKQLKNVKADLNIQVNIYQKKNKTIRSIYDKKVHYVMKSDLLHKFSEEITKFDIEIDSVKTSENYFVFELVSDNEDKITDFIKYVSTVHYKNIKNLDIKSIIYDPERKQYIGKLEVDLK